VSKRRNTSGREKDPLRTSPSSATTPDGATTPDAAIIPDAAITPGGTAVAPEPEGEDEGEDEGHTSELSAPLDTQATPANIQADQAIQSPTESEILLPSGSFLTAEVAAAIKNPAQNVKDWLNLLRQGVFFPQQACKFISNADDVKFLQSLIPSFPPTSKRFDELLETHSDYIRTNDSQKLPTCPAGLSHAELEEWFYMHAAAIHFRQHLLKISSHAPSHGEGWSDVNIWAHLLDTAFLYSQTLSLDRKELQSNVHDTGMIITAKKLPSYDGILRSSQVTTKENRIDIGFVEAKPARAPYPKNKTTDRLKVINAMRSSLRYLQSLECSSEVRSKQLVVIGIICHGTSMTVLQAWNLASQIIFFKENEFRLTLETLPLLIQTCWRLKMAAEKSLETVLDTHFSHVNQPL